MPATRGAAARRSRVTWWQEPEGRATAAPCWAVWRIICHSHGGNVALLASKRVCAITPTPAWRLLLERAIQDTSRTDILLVSNEEAERLDIWRWWRRGRVELPVQKRASLRSYRLVRRFSLARWAGAGPSSPSRADKSLAAGIGVGPPHPDCRRRTTAHQGEACGRRHCVTLRSEGE